MTNQKDTYARVKLETESDAQTVKDFLKQIEKENIDHKEKLAKLNNDINFLDRRIIANNKFLQEHKLEVVQYTPQPRKGRKVENTTPAPQHT